MNTYPKNIIKFMQTFLNKKYNCNLVVDGIIGNNTFNAISNISDVDSSWSNDRKLIACLQYVSKQEGFDSGPIDGLWGAQTDYAYELLEQKIISGQTPSPWREDDPGVHVTQTNNNWPRQIQSELEQFFGPVGQNQTKCKSPYPLKLAWDTQTLITKFSCHQKVKNSIERVLQKVLDHYGLQEIERLGLDLFGGCLNVRAMRGGTKYSTHSWGIAIDWDPVRNKLKWGKDQANFSKPEYDFWWECWEEEGWVSLGRVKGYDYMHVQACIV